MTNTNYTTDDILNKDILELMGAKDMPEEQKQALYKKMLQTIQNRVIARIARELAPADNAHWQKLAETGDQKKMADFLNSKGIDINKLMFQEAVLYKTELVELSKPVQAAAQKP